MPCGHERDLEPRGLCFRLGVEFAVAGIRLGDDREAVSTKVIADADRARRAGMLQLDLEAERVAFDVWIPEVDSSPGLARFGRHHGQRRQTLPEIADQAHTCVGVEWQECMQA